MNTQENTSRTLTILAMGPSRNDCPFDCETWVVNTGYRQAQRLNGKFSKLFLAHTQVVDKDGDPVFDWDEINSLNIDVINTHRVKGLKSRLFPMRRIVEKFGTDFFSDTICYMLAYAIDQATTRDLKLKYPFHIKLYGADMRTEDEYNTEKGGIEYWIGFARGLGIKVSISNGSTLCKTITGKPYGVKAEELDVRTMLKKSQLVNFLSTEGKSPVYIGEINEDLLNKMLVKIGANNG